MEKIYIDSDFKCHTISTDGAFQEVILSEKARAFFDDKCDAFIEGYRFIPSGESWTRSDGVVFAGEMIAPWKPYAELDAAQREYERAKLAQYEQELPQAYLDGVNSI